MAAKSESEVSVFRYTAYRDYLRDALLARLADNPRLSYRYFAKKAGFGSPTYFQQVIRGERSLTLETAKKAAAGIGLTGLPRKYFVAMVQLELAVDLSAKAAVLRQLKQYALLSKRVAAADPDIHSHWVHAVIYEMATLKDFVLTTESAETRLRGAATRAEIDASIAFLVERQYLLPTKLPGRYAQGKVFLSPFNDIRMLNLRQCHLKFLDLAKDRLMLDDVAERDFQSLTMAIASSRLPGVKARLHAFVEELRQDLANDDEADVVVHLECGLFKVG